MCWMCDHPGSTVTDYLDEVRAKILRQGWAVQYVEDPQMPYAYTVGLSDYDVPELLMTNVSPQRAARVLNGSAEHILRGAELHPGGTWDARRFRSNVLLDVEDEGWVEDGWIGHTLRLGSATLAPAEPCVRCTMVTRAQPGLDTDVDIFRTLARHHRGHFGVWSAVTAPGTVTVGDRAVLAPTAPVPS